MLLTLSNDFHGTSVRVRVAVPEGVISKRTARRVRRALCPADCVCSNGLGMRGIQAQEFLAVEEPDGTWSIEMLEDEPLEVLEERTWR